MGSFWYDGWDRNYLEEPSHSEEFSYLEELNSSEDSSDSEEHSNSERPGKSERPSNAPLSFEPSKVSHLELSIHELCHYRLGPALWTYCRDRSDLNDLLMPLRSPTDILGNTFDKNCIGQMKLLAMIHEAGLLHFHYGKDPGLS